MLSLVIKHPQYDQYGSNLVRDLVVKALEIPGT